MFTRDDLLSAIKEERVLVKRNVFPDTATWENMTELYNTTNDIRYISFGAMTIDRSEKYIKSFDKIIDMLSSIHPGQKISAMSIIHFISRHNNDLIDPAAIKMKELFINRNPHKQPDIPISFNDFVPVIHTDPVDGFYIQGNGSTLWRVFKNGETVEEHILNQGDSIFVPKNLVHSVESLCPRHAVSISFQDPTSW